jgi:hypothetical protein
VKLEEQGTDWVYNDLDLLASHYLISDNFDGGLKTSKVVSIIELN